jgi:hypothetical protein
MTPAEKAKELHFNMCKAIATELRYDGFFTNTIHAKNCALIAIDEIINEIYKSSSLDTYYLNNDKINEVEAINYYNEVKQEIEKL